MVDKKHYNLAERYWKDLLNDYITLARFPNDYFNEDDGKFNIIQKTIKKSLFNNILSFCDYNKVSLDSFLDTVFGIVLQRFTYEDDVVFGKNRALLPVRVNTIDSSEKFVDLCRKIDNQIMNSLEYDYYMLSSLGYKNSLNDKLINTAFVFDVFTEQNISSEHSKKLDLYMVASVNNGLKLKLMYKSSLYDKITARSIIYLFKFIVSQVIENYDIRLDEIQNVKKEHIGKFVEYNKTHFDFDVKKSYIDVLNTSISNYSNRIAISDDESDITYSELDNISSRIAAYLQSLGIKKGDTVAVLQERNVNVVLSAISILKAGAVFFPIDRTNPNKRIEYLLEDGNVKAILTNKSLIKRIKNKYKASIDVINLDDIEVRENNYKFLPVDINPEDEAYRISTSGTTGRPKCISIRHNSLMNMCHYSIDYINADKNDRCGVYLSFSFDAIMKQIFPYLLVGGIVDIIPEYARTNEFTVEEYCERKGITILALPAILGKHFMMNCEAPSLRVLQVGGDKFKGYKDRKYTVYNEYGPAEFTVLCTQFEVDKYYEQVPVGKPIYNTEAYILDKNNNICAVGVPGELCLSGIQISNGYLNNQEMNVKSFLDNPFKHNEYTEKMYRTGDLAKWVDEEGTISILGRMDSQIKIDGIRIEIFEIENMINRIPEVKNSVVVKRESEDRGAYLDAYFVPYEDYYDAADVRMFLENNLPAHMIPKNINMLCMLPVTPIGKVDKKALPKI